MGVMEQTACFSGHRDIPEDKAGYVRQELRREIEEAIADGYEFFISGFAQGTDLMAAAIVLELAALHPRIQLAAAIPYRSRFNQLYESGDTRKLVEGCKTITVCSEKYAPNVFMTRNRFMLELSSRLIAVYDGREKGGTAQTMRFARVQGKEIREIRM